MIAVLFEVEPAASGADRCFALAEELRPALEAIDGFLSVERFESRTRPGRYLSLSYWRDEAAVQRWRAAAGHRRAQHEGRSSLFAQYRIRVAEVLRDYGSADRAAAPAGARGGPRIPRAR